MPLLTSNHQCQNTEGKSIYLTSFLVIIFLLQLCSVDFTLNFNLCSFNFSLCIHVQWTGWAKKVSLLIFAITLSTVTQFSYLLAHTYTP